MNIIMLPIIIIAILCLILLPVLQIYLSLKEDKRLGLIIPGLTLIISVIVPTIVNLAQPGSVSILILYIVLAGGSIIVNMAIYLVCRIIVNNRDSGTKGLGKSEPKELDKMKIEDLG